LSIDKKKPPFHLFIKKYRFWWSEFLTIGFSIIGNDSRVVNSKLDKVLNMADDLGLAQIADTQIEIIHL